MNRFVRRGPPNLSSTDAAKKHVLIVTQLRSILLQAHCDGRLEDSDMVFLRDNCICLSCTVLNGLTESVALPARSGR